MAVTSGASFLLECDAAGSPTGSAASVSFQESLVCIANLDHSSILTMAVTSAATLPLGRDAAGSAPSSAAKKSRCFEQKFRRRQKSRLEQVQFDVCLQEHRRELKEMCFELQQLGEGEACSLCGIPIYEVLHCNSLGEKLHWGCCVQICGKTAVALADDSHNDEALKPRMSTLNEDGRCRMWLFWATALFHVCSAPDVDNCTNESALELCASTDADELWQGATCATDGGDAEGVLAKWLTWEKTRSEVFGVGAEPWGEGWAIDFIFGELACARQEYLWKHLARDRHFQWGMGVLPIPGYWKRTLRAKQRLRRAGAMRPKSQSCLSPAGVSCKTACSGSLEDLPIESPYLDNGRDMKHGLERNGRDLQARVSDFSLHCKPGSSSLQPAGSLRGGGSDGNPPDSAAPRQAPAPIFVECHEFTVTDFRDNTLQVKPRELTIRWAASDAVDEQTRQNLAEPHHSVETNGNGACAIHSVWGRPSPDRQLFALGARDLAGHYLDMLPQAAVSDEAAASALVRIHTSLWSDFAQPFLTNQASIEGRLFWEALESLLPELAAEARRHVQVASLLESQAGHAKMEALCAARGFFCVANEEVFIRPLAIRFGYLMAGVHVDIGINGQVSLRLHQDAASLGEGASSAQDNNGYVKGTKRLPFPIGGPDCKYSALFDSSPVFDSLREAFIVFADRGSRATLFLHCLQEQGLSDRHESFFGKLQQWIDTASPLEAPVDFGVRAWSAYLACVRKVSYLFSVDELLAVCTQASIRVLIFKEIEGILSFAGGCLHGQGPLILTKLCANSERSVRSHFERLIPASLVGQFSKTIQDEARERLREEAKLKRERQFNEAQALAEQARALKEAAEQGADKDPLPPPPPPHEGKRPSKKPKTEQKESRRGQGQDTNPSGLESDKIAAQGNGKGGEAEGLEQYSVRCLPPDQTKDPRARLESALDALSQKLREHPTVPASIADSTLPMEEVFLDDVAPLLPPKHCAFKCCSWVLEWASAQGLPTTEAKRETALVQHVMESHLADVRPVANELPKCYSEPVRIASAYNEAIGVKVRQGAPLASYAIDRKCLRKAAEAIGEDRIQGLICFLCACIYPHMEGTRNQHIKYYKPLCAANKGLFFQCSRRDMQELFSLDTYLCKYGKDVDGFFDLKQQLHEFDDWLLKVPFVEEEAVEIVCCPEDRRCSPACLGGHDLCSDCEVPLCNHCLSFVDTANPSLPPASLCNDMMIFYAPQELYEDGGLTIMEMICASPCITAMICFSMEVKYGNMFDSTLHMQRHRVGARGNATTFLLPWESLLVELQRLESAGAQEGTTLDLPRSGKDLAYVVQVLLKTNDEDERDNLKNFIFQAQV